MTRYKNNVGAFLHRNGVSFRVWAPFADSVGLIGTFTGDELPMESEKDGYWHLLVANALPGQEYKFVIRNGEQTLYRNDPRARHQTTSTGQSVIVDKSFDWEGDSFTPPAINEQVVYELHVGTFYRPDVATTGTFDDVIEKLDHLVYMGINMIELMPINTMLDDRGWGYATDYIYTVESLYGGRHGFMELVREAHKRGIGIIVDVVYNHFGPDDSLFLWQFDGWSENGKGGIYFYNDWRGDTPWGSRPDYGRYEVRQYLLDNVRMWLNEFHVDGLRVDSTIYLRNAKGENDNPSTDLPEAWHFMQELNETVKKVKPEALTFAEDIAGNEYITKTTGEGGAGFDSQWELGFPQALRSALASTDPSLINLDRVCFELTRRYNGNAFQRIGFVDSHDSAANGSSRFNDEISGGDGKGLFARQRQIVAAGIILTSPMMPMILQGQEVMEGGSFNDWQAVDWGWAEAFSGIIEAHKHLIALRRNLDGVSAGLTADNINLSHIDEENKVIVYHRWLNGGPRDDVIVVVNFGSTHHEGYEFGFPRNGTWKVRFNSSWEGYSDDFDNAEIDISKVIDGGGSITIPPSTILILSQDK